jgi:hypothetical protein
LVDAPARQNRHERGGTIPRTCGGVPGSRMQNERLLPNIRPYQQGALLVQHGGARRNADFRKSNQWQLVGPALWRSRYTGFLAAARAQSRGGMNAPELSRLTDNRFPAAIRVKLRMTKKQRRWAPIGLVHLCSRLGGQERLLTVSPLHQSHRPHAS